MIKMRVFFVEQYFKNNECLATTFRKFRIKRRRSSDLTPSVVKNLCRLDQLVVLNTLVVQKQAVQMSISKQCVKVMMKVQEHLTNELKPRRPFALCVIPCITLSRIFYDSIKKITIKRK